MSEAKKEEVPVSAAVEQDPAIASDPEEDDLDDLDDVLDEFAATKISSKEPAAVAASATTTSGPDRPPPDELLVSDEDEFARQLQAEMEQLLGQKDFGKEFENILKEMGDAVGADPAAAAAAASAAGLGAGASASASASPKPTASTTANPPAKGEENFQETIRKTMERMQASGDQASAAASSGAGGDDILAQMLKEMESGGFGGGEGNDEDFSKILMGMMEQLTNKEILYEPMKELNDKFPAWMEANRDKVAKDDLKRYEEQQALVKDIKARFDRDGYSDSNAQDREYIVERMQKMQAAGSPPPDLVGDMNAAQEALGEIDQGCPTQ